MAKSRPFCASSVTISGCATVGWSKQLSDTLSQGCSGMRRALFLLLTLVAASSFAETLYISDQLTVPIRRGPSNGHKIINAALPSGTALEVLGEDTAAGFTQVRTPNGTEGWVPTQFLVNQPIAKDRLAAATKRLETLEAQLKTTKDSYQDVRGARTEIEGRATELSKENQRMQTELAEIRRVSATAITQFEENKQLKTDNASLQ